jgi:hypothetical protein
MKGDSDNVTGGEAAREVGIWVIVMAPSHWLPADLGPRPANAQELRNKAEANVLVKIMKTTFGTGGSNLDEHIGVRNLPCDYLYTVAPTKVTVQVENHDAEASSRFFFCYLEWQEWECPGHTHWSI